MFDGLRFRLGLAKISDPYERQRYGIEFMASCPALLAKEWASVEAELDSACLLAQKREDVELFNLLFLAKIWLKVLMPMGRDPAQAVTALDPASPGGHALLTLIAFVLGLLQGIGMEDSQLAGRRVTGEHFATQSAWFTQTFPDLEEVYWQHVSQRDSAFEATVSHFAGDQ